MEKATLIVTGSYAEVQIDVLLEEDGIEDDGNLTGRGGDCLLRPCRVDINKLIKMNTILVIFIRDGSDLRSEFLRIHERHEKLLTALNRNITHMMRKTVHIIQRQKELREIKNPVVEGDIMEENTYSSVLSRFPLTLHSLHNEYEFGLKIERHLRILPLLHGAE